MGKKNQTTTTKSEPWKAAQPALMRAIDEGENLYNDGGFSITPYDGARVAGFGDNTSLSHQMIADRAMDGAPLTDAASGTLERMMDPQYQNSQLAQVKNNALSSAIPAATAQFAGSGMANSSTAMDTVGRAALEAVAPYEYGAYQTANDRAMQAAGMAPGIDAAGYMPATMLGSVGAAQDALAQTEINADMSEHYETEGQDLNNFQGYLNTMMGLGGMGGTASQTQPGASGLQTLGGSAMTGLGTYGALMANPATAALAIPGGILTSMMGLF